MKKQTMKVFCVKNDENIGVIKKTKAIAKSLRKDFEVEEIYGTTKEIIKQLKIESRNNEKNILFIRHFFKLNLHQNMLSKLKKYKKIILEMPSPIRVGIQEKKIKNKLIQNIIYSIINKTLNKANYILEYDVESKKITKKHSTKIIYLNNGIEIDSIPEKKEKNNKEIVLIGVANISWWHGFDRIIKGIKKYTGKEKIKFNIIGEGPEKNNLQKLTNSLGLEKQVIFQGIKSGEKLNKEFDQSDMGISSIGMHRINIKTASTLKSREYCARGIPFILGYEDKDFKEKKFVLTVEGNDNPIDMKKIVTFYNQTKKIKPKEIRKYAKENLSWDIQLQKIKNKIME